MTKVVAKQIVKANQIDNFISIAKELVAATLQEEGCISYALCQGTDDDKVLTFIEEWQDQATLDKHLASKHFTELFPKLTELVEEPSEITIYKTL